MSYYGGGGGGYNNRYNNNRDGGGFNSNMNRRFGMKNQQNNSKVVYIYGFPRVDERTFRQELLGPLGVNVMRLDFMPDRLMAFAHCHTQQDARAIIEHWNKRPICGGDKPLQVRFKNAPGGGGPNSGINNNGDSCILPPEYRKGKPVEPKPSENEGHDELGYAKAVMHMRFIDPAIGYNEALNVVSHFGPVHLLIAKGKGEFTCRYCFDLSNDYAKRHIEDMGDDSMLVKMDQVPQGIDLDFEENLELWI